MLQQEDLLTQKIELILEMNGKKMLAEMAKLREEIGGLREEVAGLKKAQRFGSGTSEQSHTQAPPAYREAPQQPQWQQQAPPQQWQQAPPQQQWQAPPPEQRQDKPIDRNGVSPSSVSIEKMFYFGNKK